MFLVLHLALHLVLTAHLILLALLVCLSFLISVPFQVLCFERSVSHKLGQSITPEGPHKSGRITTTSFNQVERTIAIR